MLEAIIHLPQKDNSGNDTQRDRHLIEQKLLTLSGGLTVYPCVGAWVSPEGVLMTEHMYRYVVAFDATPENMAAFERIALVSCMIMNQKAIYYKIGEKVAIMTNPNGSKLPNVHNNLTIN